MSENLHYLIVVPIIIVILILQLRVFFSALRKIREFRSLFPDNRESYGIHKAIVDVEDKVSVTFGKEPKGESDSWDDDSEENDSTHVKTITVSQISTLSENSLFKRIVEALNMYLLKNKGAVSDFLLIKDVVERHSEAESEEIDVMQPIPLYLGLMGTMIGIIAGVGLIALQGNIQNLSNISPLLGCVAVAMVASLFGISFTTFISWQSKGAKSEVEANKNTFYSWLQTELLPVLSGNAVSALSLLQSNLTEFNRTFSDNINTFDTVLSDVRTVSQEQASTIDALNRIDTKKVAQANISVLKELQKSTDNIDRFNSYIGQVNKYVAAIESLNNQLNAEMDQMEGRSEYIRGVVSSIDSALAEAMNKFGEGMRVFMESVKEESDKQMTSVQTAYDLQFKAYSEQIEELQKQLLERTKDFQKILDGISSLSATQRSISQLVDSSERNGDRLDRLVRSSSLGGGGSIPAGRRSNKVNTYLLAVITAVVVASGVTYIVGEIKTHYRPDYSFEEEYQAIEVNEDVPPVTDTLNVGEK